ncbi:MAG: PAS domain S-box protein [Chloroflexota bacterium]|nr:PAS domain S-box protein [Chloroflexota bacterium]
MKQILKNTHFWIIAVIMISGAVLYYADQIPGIQTIADRVPIDLARYSTHRILSVIPVAYAAFVFHLRGGLITAVIIGLALLPRALFISSEQVEALAEVVAFLFIGLLVSWLIDRRQQAIFRLENARRKLSDSLQTISHQQQQLTSIDAISTIVYRSMNVNEIAQSALDEVLAATAPEAGWIYLRNSETDDLVLSAHSGLHPQFASDTIWIKLGNNLDGQVALSGEPAVMAAGSHELGLRLSGKDNIEVIVVVPLRTRAGIEGTLGIATSNRLYATDQELEFLTALGNRIGLAIGHARLQYKSTFISTQLRLSEERYRGLFESLNEAIFVCSAAGRIISANKACEQLTAYSQEEMQGMTICQLFSGANQEMMKSLFASQLDEGTAGDVKDTLLVTKDGREVFIELKASPLMKDNETVGLQVIARDVTEERQLRRNMEYYITQITKAQEDERLRISRELHDDTAQVLVTLARGLDSLISAKPLLPESTIERLRKLQEMTDSALEDVRRFSQDLRPSVLDDLGLVPALEWLITEVKEQQEIITSIEITGNQRRLPQEKELAIFRIAQEALNNAKRHSQASTIEMKVDFSDDATTLVISDDGQGFYMPSRASYLVPSGKLGIIGMRERARLVGGTLIVQSEINKGTTIILRVPE